MKAGQEEWNSMLSRQSKTLEEAVQEYHRRYSMAPPDGFDDWFNYAQSQNVVLIDEFDEMMKSLVPFRKLGPEEVRRRTAILNRIPNDVNLLRVSGDGNEFKYEMVLQTGARTERTEGLISMLRPVEKLLAKRKWKEFDVVVNELAESRVLGGDWNSRVLKGGKEAEGLEGYEFSKEVWEAHGFGEMSLIRSVAKACGEDSAFAKANPTFRVSKKVEEKEDGESGDEGWDDMELREDGVKVEVEIVEMAKLEGLEWLQDVDVCNHPELTQYHSGFRTTHLTTRGLYPMLSFGAPSAYSDILFPTSYQYGGNPDYKYIPEEDMPWDKKENGLYWRGSPTGGGYGDKEFGSMHRHRLVTMTNPPMPAPAEGTELNFTLTGADAENNMLAKYISKTDYDEQFTNVTFVEIAQDNCNFFECNALNSFFKFGEHKPLKEVWRWKYVIDVDGWGYSARWRALIVSKSLALKSTIYHEWYSERMVPWVHFVPISAKMDELYDVLGYFLGGGEDAPEIVAHEEEAKKIAEAGKDWADKNMRNEDMIVYVWRLMLEMNRLYNGEDQVYRVPTAYDEATWVDELSDK
ncbi:uncharacterized protein H6S33_009172 [Morchella sextelata]|uniref:uncharacterized protein n=1 Tax=Morchella sextelata TaxID=1174677 RepID=UPI001D0583A7|nr:uncharacterized protein H6S33_009172 [Morchella sextelata]KAH0612792.1 hypothetical protein H6S33_009172 [Morchella sextelata]